MSKYAEAEFAATLLECGPHIHGKTPLPTFADMRFWDYRDRVYKYFFQVRPTLMITDYNSTPAREWAKFWTEYLAWVES